MTATEVIKAIAAESGIHPKDVKVTLEAQRAVLVRMLGEAGDKERIPILPGAVSVYRFKKGATKARMGRNPATGEPIKIAAKPAHAVVRATVKRTFKDEL